MPLKIVRNDITLMQADIIVNTANEHPVVGTGCDHAIYQAAGYDDLLACRQKIGDVPEGEVFITPAFKLQAEHIIHAVSPRYVDGEHGEEEKLRSCYKKSLALADAYHAASIAFPVISTGGFGYPMEEGLRIAVDEINFFLMNHDMLVYLVVFGERMTKLGSRLYTDLESYIDQHYVEEKHFAEYGAPYPAPRGRRRRWLNLPRRQEVWSGEHVDGAAHAMREDIEEMELAIAPPEISEFSERDESALNERMKHLSDTFSEYLIYLIDSRNMTYPEVYKRAIVDKKAFSKIKNNRDSHPKKMTVMCLCIGAMLNLDQTKDLMARAGYALSPCDKTDIIFSYFIENQIYDMIELDIQLEEHGLPCLIS